MKEQPKFKIGDMLRVKNQKRYKKVGKCVAIYKIVYKGYGVVYRYDIELPEIIWWNGKHVVERYSEFELKKVEE